MPHRVTNVPRRVTKVPYWLQMCHKKVTNVPFLLALSLSLSLSLSPRLPHPQLFNCGLLKRFNNNTEHDFKIHHNMLGNLQDLVSKWLSFSCIHLYSFQISAMVDHCRSRLGNIQILTVWGHQRNIRLSTEPLEVSKIGARKIERLHNIFNLFHRRR